MDGTIESLDVETIVLLIVSAGLGVFIKDVIVKGLMKVKSYVVKTDNKIDDAILDIIFKASNEAATKAAKKVAPKVVKKKTTKG